MKANTNTWKQNQDTWKQTQTHETKHITKQWKLGCCPAHAQLMAIVQVVGKIVREDSGFFCLGKIVGEDNGIFAQGKTGSIVEVNAVWESRALINQGNGLAGTPIFFSSMFPRWLNMLRKVERGWVWRQWLEYFKWNRLTKISLILAPRLASVRDLWPDICQIKETCNFLECSDGNLWTRHLSNKISAVILWSAQTAIFGPVK